MPELPTWDNGSMFSYTGSVENGTTITFGRNNTIIVSREQYTDLLDHFRGQTVKAGTSRTNAPVGSVGQWLQANVSKTAISSYVCPILLHEGYAEKVGRSQIRFLRGINNATI